jgi:hypothetical protein
LIYKVVTKLLARCDLELRAWACQAERPIAVRASPKRERDRHRIDIDPGPPCRLVTVPVKLAMMEATNRNRELVADLAAQRPRLRKAQMMRIGRFAAAHHARLLGHEFAVVLTAANDSAVRLEAAGVELSTQTDLQQLRGGYGL